MMSSTSLVPFLQEVQDSGIDEYGSDCVFGAITGDISNCYDELDHGAIGESLAYWFGEMPDMSPMWFQAYPSVLAV